MKQENVMYYKDPQGFSEDSKYPCSSQFMFYDGLRHRYYLTNEALAYNGIDVERKYISSNPNKAREFIEDVTDKVYEYIYHKCGLQNFQVIVYRIAIAPKTIYQDQYDFRKQFEKALIKQAQFKIENGDSARYSAEDLRKGKIAGIKPEEEIDNYTDLSTETKRILDNLGLTRWFTLAPNFYLDNNKY